METIKGEKMEKIDLTYGGKIKGLINAVIPVSFDVNYTIEGKSGETTTTSILIDGDKDTFLMITFNYQDLKKLVDKEEE